MKITFNPIAYNRIYNMDKYNQAVNNLTKLLGHVADLKSNKNTKNQVIGFNLMKQIEDLEKLAGRMGNPDKINFAELNKLKAELGKMGYDPYNETGYAAYRPIVLIDNTNKDKNDIYPYHSAAPTVHTNGSGEKEYTKEMAANRKNLNDTSIKIDSNGNITENKIKGEKLENKSDIWFAGEDMSAAASKYKDINEAADYITSRYVAAKERIMSELNGEELENSLKQLNESYENAKKKVTEKYLDRTGDICETAIFKRGNEETNIYDLNGIGKEKEKIASSIDKIMSEREKYYTDFIKSNKDYADIGKGEEWLKSDTAYMASEMRKAAAEKTSGEIKSENNISDELYTAEDLNKFADFAESFKKYTIFSSMDKETYNYCITAGNISEEELGFKLAEVNIRAAEFNKKSGVSKNMQNMINNLVNNFTDRLINAQHIYNESMKEIQLENNKPSDFVNGFGTYEGAIHDKTIERINKFFTKFDKEQVYDIINHAKDIYNKTGDATEAVMKTADHANTLFFIKTLKSGEKYDGIGRYESSYSYFENLFDGKDPNINRIMKNWNSLMGKVTDDKSANFVVPPLDLRA